MKASRWVFASWQRWILIIVLLLVASGFVYEQVSAARDRTELAQVGRSIDIGGRTLNIYCSGSGSPAVIFESGAALPGYSWVFVQREVAKLTRSCWYDRAGYGWSDSRPEPNWSDLAAADLHELLTRADVRPPYVLVGHSFGALNARVYQAMHPGKVVGMVLLDPADEATSASGGSLASRLPRPIAWLLVYAARALAHLGVVRIFAPPPGRAPGGITQREWNTIARLRNQPKAFLADIRGGPNGERVIQPARASELRRQRLAEVAQRSSRGEHVLVPNAGHMIQWDAPDAVIRHVHDVLLEVGH